jgi:hypothetical protein
MTGLDCIAVRDGAGKITGCGSCEGMLDKLTDN